MFTCPLCGNKDPRFIGYRNNKPYCRKCIDFKGEEYVEDEEKKKENISSNIYLSYSLTKEQEYISSKINEAILSSKNVLVKAVCGAGKTELVFKSISEALKRKKKVGFTVPRKNVVIDLKERFKEAFKDNKITAIYGGNTDELEGDITLLTTHQLYRFNQAFDLLIIDEIDAYPFYKNDVLYSFLKRACRGNLIILSATAPAEIVNDVFKKDDVYLELNTRHHHYPLPIPLIKIQNTFSQFLTIIKKIKEYKKEGKQVFIFVPTIKLGETLFHYLKLFIKEGNIVTSKTKNSEQILTDFKAKKYSYLVTTTILERGVTFANLQVIVFKCNHKIFSKDTLIQICGRVGRKTSCPFGEILFLSSSKCKEMEEAQYELKRANKYL